jgi:hypothetical protein
MSLLVMVPIVAALELVLRVSDTLRPRRAQLRVLLGLFWAAVLLAYYGSLFGLIPPRFLFPRGPGMFAFAADSLTYRLQASSLAATLRAGDLGALLDPEYFVYSKMIALLYVVFGTDPLVAMLFNAVFYLTTLISVFVLARTVFDERTAALSVWIAGLWPTFFLHQTQTVRWAATSAAICAMVTVAVVILGNARIRHVLAVAIVCYPILLYDVPYMARLLYLGLFCFAAILLALGLRWRRYPTRALRTVALAVALFVVYQMVWAPSARPPAAAATVGAAAGQAEAPRPSYVERLIAHIVRERQSFLRDELQGAATNFEDIREVRDLGDLIANAPAAYGAAFFAPTPGMLLGGRPGVSGGRHYVVVEMILYYLMLPFVVAGVVLTLRRPRFFLRVQGWFVVFFLLSIYGLLGTVVLNAGTLHRLRLPYVIIQLAFAAGALRALVARSSVTPPGSELREETWYPIAEVALPERG